MVVLDEVKSEGDLSNRQPTPSHNNNNYMPRSEIICNVTTMYMRAIIAAATLYLRVLKLLQRCRF